MHLVFLISVVVFAVFIIISFSGLFDYIEATFYHTRVKNFNEKEADAAVHGIDQYHLRNIETFSIIYDNDYIYQETFCLI